MEHVTNLLEALSKSLTGKAAAGAVMAKPVSAGDYHVVPLCEIAVGFGSGGGQGKSDGDEKGIGKGEGTGGGGGGGAKVKPVAVLIVDGDSVRLERLG